MTFKEFMKEVGYNLLTTFWEDFSIADKYGIVGVKDTYRRAFNEWKDDYKFFTELTLVLNHKIWQHYESNRELAALYDRLWREADEYAMSNFKGNVIYYPHTNTLSFNWNDYGGKITQEEFDDFVNNVDRSQLPEGIKFELK